MGTTTTPDIVFDGTNDYANVNNNANILSKSAYTKFAFFSNSTYVVGNNIISGDNKSENSIENKISDNLNIQNKKLSQKSKKVSLLNSFSKKRPSPLNPNINILQDNENNIINDTTNPNVVFSSSNFNLRYCVSNFALLGRR